ncbi:hypothetical protein LINGRAHAP2_LOCUS20056 [Linum grandiflorum]
MIIMSWNCREMGQPRAVQSLRELVQTHWPGVVILLETFANKSRMEEVRVALKFEGYFAVDAVGHSRGICILWRDKTEVKVVEFGRNVINVEVSGEGESSFTLAGYYGYPQRSRRSAAWDFLRLIARPSQEAWCCVGDYNDLLCA